MKTITTLFAATTLLSSVAASAADFEGVVKEMNLGAMMQGLGMPGMGRPPRGENDGK